MQNLNAENYKLYYTEKFNVYKKFGYDLEEERKFIIDQAMPFEPEILEVGTGKGYFTLVLAKQGYKFISVDLSNDEQKYAKLALSSHNLLHQVNFKIQNAEDLKFADHSFATIFCVNVAHHLNNPFKVMDQLSRVVCNTGKIILSDFSKQGLLVVDKIHALEGNTHKVSSIVLDDLANYLKNKNFKIKKFNTKFQDTIIAQT
ncbi:MAG: hypothetical protein DRP78_01345 [Candidatus Omnitrophota bacterium]|nr:MAG: hypothetical protein DRP78_01345 [Candidatus Omnitrophota bacterium]